MLRSVFEDLKSRTGLKTIKERGYFITTAGQPTSYEYIAAQLKLDVDELKQAMPLLEEILHEYANLARSNLVSYYNDDGSLKKLSSLTPAQQAAMHTIEIEEHEYTNKKGKKGLTRRIKIKLHTK